MQPKASLTFSQWEKSFEPDSAGQIVAKVKPAENYLTALTNLVYSPMVTEPTYAKLENPLTKKFIYAVLNPKASPSKECVVEINSAFREALGFSFTSENINIYIPRRGKLKPSSLVRLEYFIESISGKTIPEANLHERSLKILSGHLLTTGQKFLGEINNVLCRITIENTGGLDGGVVGECTLIIVKNKYQPNIANHVLPSFFESNEKPLIASSSHVQVNEPPTLIEDEKKLDNIFSMHDYIREIFIPKIEERIKLDPKRNYKKRKIELLQSLCSSLFSENEYIKYYVQLKTCMNKIIKENHESLIAKKLSERELKESIKDLLINNEELTNLYETTYQAIEDRLYFGNGPGNCYIS